VSLKEEAAIVVVVIVVIVVVVVVVVVVVFVVVVFVVVVFVVVVIDEGENTSRKVVYSRQRSKEPKRTRISTSSINRSTNDTTTAYHVHVPHASPSNGPTTPSTETHSSGPSPCGTLVSHTCPTNDQQQKQRKTR
jgi:cytoskeletal protein RodZ